VDVSSRERPLEVKAIVNLFLRMRRRTFVRQEGADLVIGHCEDRCAQRQVEIVLRGAVENEEEGNSNKVDECAQ
jgi:hypothetical protein